MSPPTLTLRFRQNNGPTPIRGSSYTSHPLALLLFLYSFYVDIVIARDPRSFATLSRLIPDKCYLCPDLSYKNVPPLSPMQKQGILFGGFYWQQHSNVSKIPINKIALKNLKHDGKINITQESWHVTVNRLRSASLLITGKHHEVIAACIARCPFFYCPIQTFKIDALGDFAGTPLSPLDLSISEQELTEKIQSIDTKSDEFVTLFDALDKASTESNLTQILSSLIM